MKSFLDRDFLLETETSKTLFHRYAAPMPIIDYHCHVNPQEIAEDRQYENITQLWLRGNHYKWRMMRWCGIDEEYITGGATDKEKFDAFASALPQAIGNPLYHWSHLELQRYFGCTVPLSPATSDEIWELCNKRLESGLSAREIIRQSNVEAICTTDDPADSLDWHRAIAIDGSFSVKVRPTFRPDKAMAIDKPGYTAYLAELGKASGHPIHDIDDLYAALTARLAYFISNGCCIADHGFDDVPWQEDLSGAGRCFQKALRGEQICRQEVETFKAAVLLFLGAQYARHRVVMQLHYGVQRNVNPLMFESLGPDSGFDCMDTPNASRELAGLLGALEANHSLPKTILYALNPCDNAMLASLAGSFQKKGTRGWVQHGSAWWFNDTREGMTQQLTYLANLGVLGSFVGMLTDSRSFLSYTRHEYFRRVLCNLVGKWVENGEYPADMGTLESLVKDISCNNARNYFCWDQHA